MLRIIAGKHRGRRIELKRNAPIRPTGGMARGAIFNILMHGQFSDMLPDNNVIDLFCGTGALGLEALSRGAGHVTFVDQSAESLDMARTNATYMGEVESTSFIRSDSTQLPHARKQCHVAFLDPPYNSGLASKGLASLHQQGWLVPGAVAVVETSSREKMGHQEGYRMIDEREYGNSRIAFFRYEHKPQN